MADRELRSRSSNMAASNASATGAAARRVPTASTTTTTTTVGRNPPVLPTPLEMAVLAAYPVILLFGTFFSLLSPETRAAPYDAVRQSHVQATAPSYFARKDNVLNVLFVKRGWFWVTVAFFGFALTHPALAAGGRRVRAATRWALVTGWWVLVTQWCFGPALIDRGFRWTGGRCEVAEEAVFRGAADPKDVFTAVACKAGGGRWNGGHDISGHVFLLVLGSFFLLQEVGWVLVRGRGLGLARDRGDERTVVMSDGAIKGAGVEAERDNETHGLGYGGQFVAIIVALCCWMLLMTAIYFHTWFEKLTGLLVAFIGIYPIYILPRWVPALRGIVGLPGI